ncbi:hypothetical protein BA065_02235 [Nanoarchaeota archaeon NZ13-N]|nr:MAG: hypothetical protein BA065_02235 [Nanoarchaeota archaeon NZ13-N]
MGLFDVKSVAIVGASAKEGKVGNIILKNFLQDFKGKIYPVNPNYNEIYSLKCYPSISSIEENVDMIVVAVPAEVVPEIIEEAGKKGVKLAVIISAGFSEIGDKGKKLEDKIRDFINKYRIRVIGPNCMGIYDPYKGIDTFFVDRERLPRPKKGKIALITQSGAIGLAFMEYASYRNIGVSKIVSYGNKIDIDEVDMLRELKEDENTESIFIYMEGLRPGRGKEFIEIAKGIDKPIVILKAGKTKRGNIAASSHTSAMAGDYDVYRNVFENLGIIEAESFHEFMIYLKIASYLRK